MYKIISQFDNSNSWLKENFTYPPFNQSFEWEQILLNEKKLVERLVVKKENEVAAMALVEYFNLPFGWYYAFCPKGPMILPKYLQEKNEILKVFINYLKKKNCLFFRIEPEEEFNNELLPIKVSLDINPRATLVLNLQQTPEDLLKKMHQKTRYNINLSLKKSLKISDAKNIEVFMALMKKTAQRDNFRLHKLNHYQEIINSPFSYMLTVYSENQAIATAVFIGFGDTFTYLFGASDYDFRFLMAPYLIQWEGIKLGQRYGYKYYDFFGIAPKMLKENNVYNYDQNHQYAGVTRFKLGFSGSHKEWAGTFDIIIFPFKYFIYNFLRKIKRKL